MIAYASSDKKTVWINSRLCCLARFCETSTEYFDFDSNDNTKTIIHTENNTAHWNDFVSEVHKRFSISVGRHKPTWVNLREDFHNLKEQWRHDTRFMSFKLGETESAKKIVALGQQVVPLIIDEMKTSPDHWFVILEKIFDKGPVIPENCRGKIREINQIWLDWLSDI